MRGRVIALASIVCLSALTVLPAAGQDSQPSADPQTTKNLEVTDAKLEMTDENLEMADKNVEMAEDLEIMGAILRATLTQVYAPPGTQPGVGSFDVFHYNEGPRSARGYRSNNAGWRSSPSDPNVTAADGGYGGGYRAGGYGGYDVYNPMGAVYSALTGNITPGLPKAVAVKRPEGVYLENYGVVYQITLDAPAPEERQPKDAAEDGDEHPRAARAWEIAVRSLRGQPRSQPPRAGDEVYRLPTKDDLVGKLLDVLAENARNLRHLKSGDRLTVAITFPRKKAPVPGEGFGYVEFINPQREERSTHEVSGDLHMRQGNYQQAIKAYERLLGEQPISPSKRSPRVVRKVRSIYLKLAQAYTAAGELDTAQKAIGLALARRGDSENQKNTSAPASPAIPLPARLTVSVTKSRLDEVAAGKLKREELKEHASVDYFNPPADRPGLGSPRGVPSSDFLANPRSAFVK